MWASRRFSKARSTPAPVPFLEEVEEGLDPAEQQALVSQLADEAKAEITTENLATAVAALEAELGEEPGED